MVKEIIRNKSILIAIAALVLICLIPVLSGTGKSFKSLTTDSGAMESMIAGRSETKDLPADIYFDGRKLVYDAEADTYYYSLKEGSKSACSPSVKISSKVPGVKAAFVDALITDELIRNNESITVLLYNRDSYRTCYLKCTTLPIMTIDCNEEIGDEYTPIDLTLFDNSDGAAAGSFESKGVIRRRGGITSEYDKFPLRFKLQRTGSDGQTKALHMSLLGMPENNNWILYPAYNDEDRVRNVFSQNLWDSTCSRNNAFGKATGVEYKYLEVFMNGSYGGLYALGYTLDEDFMGISKKDNSEGLFKKVLDTRYDLLEMRENPEEAVRGYRIITDDENKLDISPKWNNLVHYFTYLDEHSAESGRLLEAIDIDNAIDFALFTDLVQGDDSIYKNFYLAVLRDKDGRKKTLYCPWDLDSTWGNEFYETAKNRYAQYSHSADYNFFMEDTYLEQILVNGDTDTMDRYIARYRELRSDLWSDDAVKELLEEYEKVIFGSGAYLREMERWPDSNIMEGPTYDLSRFKDYAILRLHEFDEYFDRLENVKEESTLIRRTAAMKHFYESDIVMEIKDRDILNEPEYLDFISRIGNFDPAMITEDIRYIVYLRDENSVFLVPRFGGLGDSYTDGDVTLSLDIDPDGDYFLFFNDQDYTLFLNGVPCYDSSNAINERLVVATVYQGKGQKMNTAINYNLEIDDSVYEFLTPEELYELP